MTKSIRAILINLATGCAAAVVLLVLALTNAILINPWLAAGVGFVAAFCLSWVLDHFGLVLTWARFIPPDRDEGKGEP